MKNTENNGLELLLRTNTADVSDEVIGKCVTFKDALKLAKQVSGLSDKVFCQELVIDPGTWSRIWGGTAHFPDDEKLGKFIRLCGNLIPLRWLAHHFGHGLLPLQSAVEIENDQLRKDLDEERKKNKIITEFMKTIKA